MVWNDEDICLSLGTYLKSNLTVIVKSNKNYFNLVTSD